MTRLALLLLLPATAAASPHPACAGLQGQAFGQCQAWFSVGCDVDPSQNACQALLGSCATSTVWDDADGDGYGAGSSWDVCAVGPGTVEVDGDCDDADAAVSPAATEVCGNGIDDDCNGVADDGCAPVLLHTMSMQFAGGTRAQVPATQLPEVEVSLNGYWSCTEDIGDELVWSGPGTAVVDASNDADFATAAACLASSEYPSAWVYLEGGGGSGRSEWLPGGIGGTITEVEFVVTELDLAHNAGIGCHTTHGCWFDYSVRMDAYIYGTP